MTAIQENIDVSYNNLIVSILNYKNSIDKINEYKNVIVTGRFFENNNTLFLDKIEHKGVYFFNVTFSESLSKCSNKFFSIGHDDLLGLKREDTVICINEYDTNKYARWFAEQGFGNILDIYRPWQREEFADFFACDTITDNLGNIRRAAELLHDSASIDVYFNTLLYRLTLRSTFLITPSAYDEYLHPAMDTKNIRCIADCGAFTGDTVRYFRDKMGSNVFIYAFEPDAANFSSLAMQTAEDDRVKAVRSGIWSREERLRFVSCRDGSHIRVGADGEACAYYEIDAVDIDSFFENRVPVPDFIKMDIEGAEREALRGGRSFVACHKPHLAVCAYHKYDDLWKIPLLLHELNPTYALFMGHHNPRHAANGTVVYAVQPKAANSGSTRNAVQEVSS